ASREYNGAFTIDGLREIQQGLLLQIAAWFHELSIKVRPKSPTADWLTEFRKRVRRENAALISFNWDLVLDELLFADNLTDASYGFGKKMSDAAVLLKPHGSLNWFKNPVGNFIKQEKRTILHEEGSEIIYAFLKFRAPISDRRSYFPLIVPPHHLKRFDQ